MDLFKEIETNISKLQNAPLDANFKWYEDNTLDAEKKNKLYTIRVLRNYISHNSDSDEFIAISDAMYSFMKGVLNEIISEILSAKDIATNKYVKCTSKDKAIDVLKLMTKKKLEYIPLIDNDVFVGVVSIYDLIDFVMENKTKNLSSFSKFKKNAVKFVKPTLLVEDIQGFIKDENILFIFMTNSGTSKDSILGIIPKNQ
jgi:predicted transcriptional regulator